MRVRAQLVVAGALMLGGASGFLLAVAANGPGFAAHHRHTVLPVNLWWLAPVALGMVWVQLLVVRYRNVVRRRLGQLVPALCAVLAGAGLALLGRSVLLGCGALTGAVLLLVELVVLGGVLGATSPG